MDLSDQLRAAILAVPVSRDQMARETGVAESILSRFVNRTRSLDLTTVDKLAAYRGLELVKKGRRLTGEGTAQAPTEAAQSAAQQAAESTRIASQRYTGESLQHLNLPTDAALCGSVQDAGMTPTGFEPVSRP